MDPMGAEEPETARERRKKIARLLVVLFFGIPVVYGVVMGIVEIVRSILEDLR
jgi:hypothetical protein